MICIARTFGAPETVPAGNVARSRSQGVDAVAQLAGDLGDEVRDVREALDLRKRSTSHGAGPADAGEVVAAEVDEHHVLGAILLRGEQAARRRPRRAASCRRSGSARARALELDVRLRRRADSAIPSSSSRNRYGEGLTRRSAR